MGSWVPDTEHWWVAPVAVMCLIVLLELALRGRLAMISLDVLENCNLQGIQESARNIWTNLAVTAALLLTVAVAMLQADAMEPRFEVDDDMRDALANLQSAYDLCCGLSIMYCISGVLHCVIFLCYVDPLSNKDTIKFFIANPASIGSPVLHVVFGSLFCIIALFLYVLGTSGAVNGGIFGFVALVFIIYSTAEIYDKSAFDPSGTKPKANEWQWTLKDKEEWPWFAKIAKNEKAVRIFQKMGKAVQDDGDKKEAWEQ